MNIYTIYLATCLRNGKQYVGYTNNFERRVKEHIRNSQNPNNKLYNSHLYRAIRAHGADDFTWCSIFEAVGGKDVGEYMLEIEHHFILQYNTYDREYGYNVCRGGKGAPGYRHSPETLQKMRGRKCTPEERAHMSAYRTGRKKGPQTPEHIAKRIAHKWTQSASQIKDRVESSRKKKIEKGYRVSTNYGMFYTFREAAEAEGVKLHVIEYRVKSNSPQFSSYVDLLLNPTNV
jgi:group I intron endonuclease